MGPHFSCFYVKSKEGKEPVAKFFLFENTNLSESGQSILKRELKVLVHGRRSVDLVKFLELAPQLDCEAAANERPSPVPRHT